MDSRSIIKDVNNSTTTPLGAGGSFIGTASEVLEYNQISYTLFFRPNQIPSGDGSTAKASVFFEFSPDGTNWDISVPSFIRSGIHIPVVLVVVDRYFRIRYLNDGGVSAIAALGLIETAGTPTAQTQFRLNSYLIPTATKELGRTVDQGVSGSDPVTLGRSVIMGKTPGGNYDNLPASGLSASNNSATPLGISGVFTGTFEIVEGHNTISVLIKTDKKSASNGLQIQWSSDGVTVDNIAYDEFSVADVAMGSKFIVSNVRARYLRIIYTNGTVGQSSLLLNTRLYSSFFAPPENTEILVQTRARLGQLYIVNTNVVNVSGTAEQDFFLMKNPAGPAKNLRLNRAIISYFTTTTAAAVFRFYYAPTITTNGTTLTGLNVRTDGPVPVAETYLTPTISDRGTFREAFVISTSFSAILEFNLTRYLLAGENMLVTIQKTTASGLDIVTNLSWDES